MPTGQVRIPKIICCATVLTLHCFCIAAQNNRSPNPAYHLLAGKDFVTAKNYYLLNLFEQLPEVKKLLAADATLSVMARAKEDSLTTALTTCGRDGLCYIERMKFTDAEIRSVSERLTSLYQPGNALGKLVHNHLLPSGAYVLFQNLSAKEMLVKAWEQDAAGINFCIDVYAGGNKPKYPLIDSISFYTKELPDANHYRSNYVNLLYNACSLVALESKKNSSFFYTSLACALRFLEMNERDQAADFEPMNEGENKPGADRVKTIDWKKFKYSVILIPGAGPDEPFVALSAEGMLRCRLGALEYKNGTAPFIVVSGGKVHPYKTPFCEATEMKRYLIKKLNIPPNAILIDPHARHTTTNMRNTVRLIYRYGIPFGKPAIACTTRGQSSMISNTLIDRCLKELNEAPYKNGKRLSETEVEFYPLIEALQINPKEPMDP